MAKRVSKSNNRCPDPFLEVRVEYLDVSPELTVMCAGYELGAWRCEQLAKHLLHWLPEFALRYTEWQNIGAENALRLVAQAALSIYKTDKHENRGEVGEILLHAIVRQRFGSFPVVSKYFYKDSSNDTVKGFDAVHIVKSGADWELWLGEVKFYENIDYAINDVVAELIKHSGKNYLRGEFLAISNKIDRAWPDAQQVLDLLHENTPLDRIFQRVCIPVLLTYDSATISSHKALGDKFKLDLEKEVTAIRNRFAQRNLPTSVTVRLLLLPLHKRTELVNKFDEVLKLCQALS